LIAVFWTAVIVCLSAVVVIQFALRKLFPFTPNILDCFLKVFGQPTGDRFA